MLRLISRALVALALLAGPVAAQTFTLPELGLQNSGSCRQLAARDRTSNAMIALGCLDTVAKGWNLTPQAVQIQGSGSTGNVSGMSATAADPSGFTISRSLASKFADSVSLKDFGAVGDGVTSDDLAWRNALSAIAGGGKLRIPCGVYKLTPFAFNVLPYKELVIEGSGSCSELYFPGLTGTALRINITHPFAAFHLRDFHLTTDTPSDTSFGIAAYGPSGNLAAAGAFNDISHVVLRAHAGQYQTGYFGVGVYLNLVNNVTWDGFQYWGANADGSASKPYKGVAVKFEGTPTGCTQTNGSGVTTNFCYAVGYRFANSYLTQCATCVLYGNYAQAVSFVNTDIQGSYIGIQVPAGQTANDGLSYANGQIFAIQQGIQNLSAKSFSFVNASCQIIAINSSCLYLGGKGGASITNSHFNGNDTGTGSPVSGSTAIFVTSTAINVVATGNTYNFLATGNFIQSGAANINVQSNSYVNVSTPNSPSTTSGTVVIGGGSP